jgi:hypothetical protein
LTLRCGGWYDRFGKLSRFLGDFQFVWFIVTGGLNVRDFDDRGVLVRSLNVRHALACKYNSQTAWVPRSNLIK